VAASVRHVPPRLASGSRTIGGVQGVEVMLLIGASFAMLGAAAVRMGAMSRNRLVVSAVLGIIPGLLGAFVALFPRTDLVPDSAEPAIWLVIGTAVTGIILAAATIGLARR
jgi:hypothetical protein